MRSLSFKGIVIGSLSDIVLTNILSFPLLIYIVSTLDLTSTPEDQVQSTVLAAIHSNFSFHILQLFIGLTCSMLGGYIAAWIAKHDELLNGALASIFCLSFGIYAISTGKASGALWEQLLIIMATPAVAMFGGYLRLVRVNSLAKS